MGLFDGIDPNLLQQIFASGAGPNAPMMPTPPPQLTLTPQGPGFADRFDASRPSGVMPSSPISPEAVAHNLAARGVPPPPVDVPPAAASPAPNMPTYRNDVSPEAMDKWRASVDVGGALTGNSPVAGGTAVPPQQLPLNIKTPVQQTAEAAPTDVSASANQQGGLGKALSGLKMPANPTVQHIASPAAPKANARVQPSQLIALLQQLGIGGATPNPLGQAIRRG